MTRAEKERIILWLIGRNPHWSTVTLQKMPDKQLLAVYFRTKQAPSKTTKPKEVAKCT